MARSGGEQNRMQHLLTKQGYAVSIFSTSTSTLGRKRICSKASRFQRSVSSSAAPLETYSYAKCESFALASGSKSATQTGLGATSPVRGVTGPFGLGLAESAAARSTMLALLIPRPTEASACLRVTPLFIVVTTPDPDEGIGQRLLEDPAVAVAGAEAENKAVVVTFALSGSGGALAGHDPVVMGFFGVIGRRSFSETCVKMRSGFFSLFR